MQTENVSRIAALVIEKCGGVMAVAKLTQRSPMSIYKWRHSKSKGGTGGLVPSEAQQLLMQAARRGEVDLTPADFFQNTEAASPNPDR